MSKTYYISVRGRAMTEEVTLETKQLAEISLYMFEQYRKDLTMFYTSGKHHVAIPQFHHWLRQLIAAEEAEHNLEMIRIYNELKEVK